MTDTHDSSLSLDDLVRKMEEHTVASDDHVLKAALYFRELRRRIDSGEAGAGVDWRNWVRENSKLKPSRLRELMFIADSDDPVKALHAVREKTSVRVERHRQKKAADWAKLGPMRQRLISHIKGADEQRVRQIFREVFPGDSLVHAAAEAPSTNVTGSGLH